MEKERMNGLAYKTSVFDSQLRRPHSSATTAISSDVIARQERQLIAHTNQMVVAHFQFGNRCIELTYPDYGDGLPKWVNPVIQSVCERWGMESNWDGYGAKPTDIKHVSTLLHKLFSLMQTNSKPPIITPLFDGGVQAEWCQKNQNLEIEISANAPPEFYYYNVSSGAEEEGALDQNFMHVRDLITKF